jgi:hypothetical protein
MRRAFPWVHLQTLFGICKNNYLKYATCVRALTCYSSIAVYHLDELWLDACFLIWVSFELVLNESYSNITVHTFHVISEALIATC